MEHLMSLPLQSSVKNRILAALPPLEFAMLAKRLTHVELALASLCIAPAT
jgi:hypothetical protein